MEEYYVPSGHIQAAIRKKERPIGRGWKMKRESIRRNETIERGSCQERRGRRVEKYWPRQAVSGLPIFRALLVDPYEANYTLPRQRHPTYNRQSTFLGLFGSRPVLQHVPVILDTATVKAAAAAAPTAGVHPFFVPRPSIRLRTV